MMLYPSIDKLIEKVPSKYGLIILASKRAHDMRVNHDYLLDNYESEKAVGKALEEVIAEKLMPKE
ncbi:DNA-directed RNA polymerase subunit omega [Aerococcaceae bacterium zg-ZJ1578]|uniref:DNA-directed RNA polymerase subunit omega n=1 Tax=Aerococcaceae TaxID=186827 RepID=UPI0013BE0AE3|nr:MULTISPECIES: DNA-directed RNA polymerase subunit omega [unclassified Facklamia]MBK0347433.1 DNA-directed RNA polymerase subunit omega [Aerococcaceae bacterium zg-1578]MBR7926575.1 DNA-directed RNA polymerase subunit omega [Aerococcaceae bacterium zg-ZUI334]MBS4461524.1 DNA-directed RNA polymerase subunit omega [Aerococcaceae bacterium zg-B36]QQD65170.1 DNA-directed RNA polymerase subunit omega [Aerococcaceae bacterium zg-252]NEW63817.1 DNA-directed RNA polymerase subunit omega [Facklamia s